MRRALVLSSVLMMGLISASALACPNCHDSVGSGKPPIYLLVIGIFILLTYIPFFILFRSMKTYAPENQAQLDDEQN